MTPQEEARLAGDAQHIVTQPLFARAKNEVYENLRKARANLAVSPDSQAAMDLIRLEQVADMFFDYFESIMLTGRLANQRLAEFEAAQAKRESGLKLFSMFGRNGV